MADPPIYFRDKKDELKGPFNEKQMQEWYRKGWFDSSFQIKIGDSGAFQSLESLRNANGVECPFIEDNVNDNELKYMRKRLNTLKDRLLNFDKIIERIEGIERSLKDVKSPIVSDSMDQSSKPSPKEKLDRLCNMIAKMTYNVITSRIPEKDKDLAASRILKIQHPGFAYNMNITSVENLKLLYRREGFSCMQCMGLRFSTPYLFILHVTDKYHTLSNDFDFVNVTAVYESTFKDDLRTWLDKDTAQGKEGRERFESEMNGSVRASEAQLIDRLDPKVDELILDKSNVEFSVRCKVGDDALKYINQYLTSNGRGSCTMCKFLSRDIDDYYRHILSFGHYQNMLRSTMTSGVNVQYLITTLIGSHYAEKYLME